MKILHSKKLLLISGVTLLVLGGGGYGIYRLGQQNATVAQSKNAANTTPTNKTKDSKTSSSSAQVKETTTIKDSNAAGLLNASYTKNLTDFTPWADSPYNVEYRDFNDDGVTDAFVWAKLPGTGGYSFAAVWTLDSGNKPKQLWSLPDDLVLGHSTWNVTSNNGLENKSLKSDGTTDAVNTFHWQVSTTGSGFVLEPNI